MLGTSELRRTCRLNGIVPQWNAMEGGQAVKRCLPNDEMLRQLERVRLQKDGATRYLNTGAPEQEPSKQAYCFWSAPIEPPGTTFPSETFLPVPLQIGSLSAMQRGGMSLTLYTYASSIRGVPTGLEVKDAGHLVPRPQAVAALGAGMRIQQLADWVRLKAVYELPSHDACERVRSFLLISKRN